MTVPGVGLDCGGVIDLTVVVTFREGGLTIMHVAIEAISPIELAASIPKI